MKENVYDVLKKLDIDYEEIKHEPLLTVQNAHDLKISNKIDGIECKNLFVKSKKSYYIIFIKSNKKADLHELSKLINESRFSFASPKELKEILNLDIGSVTPLSIINDKDNKVSLILDQELENKKVLVHPNVNTKTLSIYYNDLIKYIEYTNHKYYTYP